MPADDREKLTEIWWAGVRAVRGYDAVDRALERDPIDPPDAIAAVGKAAASMAKAAVDRFGADVPCLVVTKYGHAGEAGLPPHVKVIESAHPVPDENSIRGGRALGDLVSGLPPGARLLLLVSGGASALAEYPEEGWTLDAIAAENARLLASGLDIHAMNTHRSGMSRIKAGRLLSAFRGAAVTTLAVSDVEGDSIAVIGSGIGAFPPDHAFAGEIRIVASNTVAREAAARAARDLGLPVLSSEETLYCDVRKAAERIAGDLDGTPGLRIWGGEPTTVLPDNPGVGGRNQALALEVAGRIAGRPGLTVLVAGTDGSDGPTTSAGGFADGALWTDAARAALARADSGTFLAEHGALFETGPTGTNVMDLAIALQRRGPRG